MSGREGLADAIGVGVEILAFGGIEDDAAFGGGHSHVDGPFGAGAVDGDGLAAERDCQLADAGGDVPAAVVKVQFQDGLLAGESGIVSSDGTASHSGGNSGLRVVAHFVNAGVAAREGAVLSGVIR